MTGKTSFSRYEPGPLALQADAEPVKQTGLDYILEKVLLVLNGSNTKRLFANYEVQRNSILKYEMLLVRGVSIQKKLQAICSNCLSV